MTPVPDGWICLTRVAHRLGLAPSCLFRWIAAGRLPEARRFAGKLFLPVATVRQLLRLPRTPPARPLRRRQPPCPPQPNDRPPAA